MASSPHFDFYRNTNEQSLLEDLVFEAIQNHSDDMFYIIRQESARSDDVLNYDPAPIYQKYYEIEFFVKSIFEFEGDGSFVSKFGLEIRDQITLVLSRRSFEQEITRNEESIVRPREGDVIFLPFHKKLFKIVYVNAYKVFYQLGALTSWEIKCELFDYSNEVFNTGIPEIDSIMGLSLNQYDYGIIDHAGKLILDDKNDIITDHLSSYEIENIDLGSDNDIINNQSENIIDWTQSDPFSERLGTRV